jgi:hypothetical protein
MAVELWIDDGNPWYLSPDIWVVPSDDPNDPPGMPFEGISAYVWARVHNRGSTAVSNATVRYYWADPSTLITLATATLIGTSSASLAAGETKDVLCVTPWVPQFVNSGLECLVAEAFAPADPLPPSSPSDPIDVPGDRHVAQRNISVGKAAPMMMFLHPFVMGAGGRAGGKVALRVRRAPLEILKPLVRAIGLDRLPDEAPELDEVGVRPYRCGEPVDDVGKPELALEMRPGERRGMALAVRVPEKTPDGAGALFLVEQLAGDEVVGGVGVLVLAEGGDDDQRRRERGTRKREPKAGGRRTSTRRT